MINDIPQSLLDAVNKVLMNEAQEEHPMIDVDGVMKHRHNSMGQPIHHTEDGIKNFHRWFGNSRVVDDHGRPKVMYHGTTTPKNFATFKSGKGGVDELGKGMYFADKTYAEYWARGDSARILPVYLKAEKLYDYSKHKSAEDLSKHVVAEIHKHAKEHPEDVSETVKAWLKEDKSLYARHVRRAIALNNGDFNDFLKIAGYHGGYHKHSQVPTQIVMFDQNNIKSAIGNTGKFSIKKKSISESIIESEEDYRGSHTAPGPDYGAPAHDLTRDIYPSDFYSSKGARLYGDGRDDDYRVHSQLRTLRNRPEAEVNIYRAVPNDSTSKEINPGDWVTTNLQYAHDHGERFDSHKILSKRVKAKELFTDGNSFHEFGYHPQD